MTDTRKHLKAYKVHCCDDDHGAVIVFAESSKDVSKNANSDRCDCEFIGRLVHRAKGFDDLANIGRDLTPKDHIERGWYWGCPGCHEEMLTAEDNPLYVGEYVFCNRHCVERIHREWLDLANSGRAHATIVALWTAADEYLTTDSTEQS